MSSLEEITKQILEKYKKDRLMPIDSIIFKISDVINEPNISVNEIANVIEKSSTISTELLKIANSVYYRRNKNIETIPDAILQLGFDAIIPILLKYSIFKKSKSEIEYKSFTSENLWNRNLLDAIASQYICDGILENQKGHKMYLISLLKNFGIKLLSNYYPNEYKEVLTNKFEKNSSLIDEEEKIFGISHLQLTGEIMKEWNFTPEIYKIVSNHHQEKLKEEALQQFEYPIKIIQLASNFLPHIGFSDCHIFDKRKYEKFAKFFKTDIEMLGQLEKFIESKFIQEKKKIK